MKIVNFKKKANIKMLGGNMNDTQAIIIYLYIKKQINKIFTVKDIKQITLKSRTSIYDALQELTKKKILMKDCNKAGATAKYTIMASENELKSVLYKEGYTL